MKNIDPYLTQTEVVTRYFYNKDYGDNRTCQCGHVYYRHFDSWMEMEAVGCKYCGCSKFKERKLVKDIGTTELAVQCVSAALNEDTDRQMTYKELLKIARKRLYGCDLAGHNQTVADVYIANRIHAIIVERWGEVDPDIVAD